MIAKQVLNCIICGIKKVKSVKFNLVKPAETLLIQSQIKSYTPPYLSNLCFRLLELQCCKSLLCLWVEHLKYAVPFLLYFLNCVTTLGSSG